MATWKEDIIKALENLGGKAHLSEIYKEVRMMKKNKVFEIFYNCQKTDKKF